MGWFDDNNPDWYKTYQAYKMFDDIGKTTRAAGKQAAEAREQTELARRRLDFERDRFEMERAEMREQTRALEELADSYSLQAEEDYEMFLEQQRYSASLEDGIVKLVSRTEEGLESVRQEVEDAGSKVARHVTAGNIATNYQLYRIGRLIEEDTGRIEVALRTGFSGANKRLSRIDDSLRSGFRAVHYRLKRVDRGIAGLRADFNIAMGKVLLQFELSTGSLRTGLDEIAGLLRNPRKTEAREHFEDGMKCYSEGCAQPEHEQWFADALNYFRKSVELHSRNPVAHLHLGHIRHYQREHRDFAEAIRHYRSCYVYAQTDPKQQGLAAQGYFYAGWLEAAANKNFKEAITLTLKALELDPNLPEAHYNLAKFYSCAGEKEAALKYLATAVTRFDRSYLIKATADRDFDGLQEEIFALHERLRDLAKARFNLRYCRLEQLIDWRGNLKRAMAEILVGRGHADLIKEGLPLSGIREELARQWSEYAERSREHGRAAYFLRKTRELAHRCNTYFVYQDTDRVLKKFEPELEKLMQKDKQWIKAGFERLVEQWLDGERKKKKQRAVELANKQGKETARLAEEERLRLEEETRQRREAVQRLARLMWQEAERKRIVEEERLEEETRLRREAVRRLVALLLQEAERHRLAEVERLHLEEENRRTEEKRLEEEADRRRQEDAESKRKRDERKRQKEEEESERRRRKRRAIKIALVAVSLLAIGIMVYLAVKG